MKLILQSDYMLNPGTLAVQCHPDDFARIKEMVGQGLLLKGQPETVDGLLIAQCEAIAGERDEG